MGKVFVHIPLKRAELRRITQPPEERTPVPLPKWEVPNLEDKHIRSLERNLARQIAAQDNEQNRIMAEVAGDQFIFACFKCTDFSHWMMRKFTPEKLATDFKGKSCTLLMTLTLSDNDRVCLQCGKAAFRKIDRGSIGIMVPSIEVKAVDGICSFALCDKCHFINRKATNLLIGRTILELAKTKGEIDIIRRSLIHKLDYDFLNEVVLPYLPISAEDFNQFNKHLAVSLETE